MNKIILELCLSPDLGGLELFMINCYKSFKLKTNCFVVVQEDSKLDSYLKDDSNKLYIKRNKLLPLIPALKLASYIDTNDIDIIHFHWTRDINTVVLAKKMSKKNPQIIQTRNMSMTRFKNDFYHKWLYKNINTIQAVTYQVKDQLEKFIPDDIRPHVEVIYMGTQSNLNTNFNINGLKTKYKLSDEFIVGIVGRIEDAKGQFLIIDAILQLKELNIKALIVGDTMDKVYLEKLKEKIITLGIQNKVIFTGFTKEVNEHMQLFDVNILATPKETFGLVVIEAMVNKVCMIATNKGGPLEIIEDNVDGLLFDRTSEDLASKIKLLYDDQNLKDTLSSKAYEKVKTTFDLDTQNDKLYNVIEKM